MEKIEAIDNAYTGLKSMLPKECAFFTSACLDDPELIERMGISYDLGLTAIGSAFLFALQDGYVKDEKEAESINHLMNDAKFSDEEHVAVLSLYGDIKKKPEAFGIPADRRDDTTKSISWMIANIEQIGDPRARVIEKRKAAAKKAIDAVSALRDRMDADLLHKGRSAIN